MYRRQVRRRRAVLATLVVGSLALISLHFSEGSDGPVHSVQGSVASVLGPVEEGADRALKPVRDLVDWVDETFEARSENDKLRAQNEDLRDQVAALQIDGEELRELRKLKKLDERNDLGSLEPVGARVIGRSSKVWYSAVRIDKGKSSGIEVDDPVVAGGGLVGHVSQASRGSSNVTLITDHTSAVTAKALSDGPSGRDGPSGVIKPEVGDPKDLLLELIEDGRRVREGTTLVTAGFANETLDSRFPSGIRIGEVSDASVAEQVAEQRVQVRPFADLADFDVVEVLTASQGGETPR